MKEIIIYGAGPFAELMLYHFTEDSDYRVVAFCLDKDYIKNRTSFCNLPLLTIEDIVLKYPTNKYNMFVAIGYQVMRNREIMYIKAKKMGYTLVNFISSKANIHKNLVIGENNVIQSSCDIEPFVAIGNNNIFWTGTIVGHNARIGNHNYLSGGCGVGGNCIVGNLCFMGNAALMVNNLIIKDETYLISGCILLKSTKKYTRYHGNPSKLIGTHKELGIIIAD